MTPAARAASLIGKAAFIPHGSKTPTRTAGMCEAVTRTAFGFPAKYPSARQAWLASKAAGPVHADTTPPPGVPVFFDITAGVNAGYDHVAVSVGGGYCISTSVGPQRTVARVRISDFGRTIWPGAVRYLGWAEFYHDQRVYDPSTAPKPTAASSSVRAYQSRQNTYGHAGLLVDGVDGACTKAWRSWVRKAQAALDHYKGVQGKVVADGDYGPKFKAQVRTVQSRNGLIPDGVLGNKTAAFMRSAGSSLPNRPKTRP